MKKKIWISSMLFLFLCLLHMPVMADISTGTNQGTESGNTEEIETPEDTEEPSIPEEPKIPETLDAPVISKVLNEKAGMRIRWNAVAFAEKYEVYRKDQNGAYSRIGSTDGTDYLDSKALVNNTSYFYKVVALANTQAEEPVKSESQEKCGYRLDAPEINTVTNKVSGHQIQWNRVPGATGYLVYRSDGIGAFRKIATVQKPNYWDQSAKNNSMTYRYRIYSYKQVTGQNYWSIGSVPRTAYRLKTIWIPSLASNTNTSFTVRWTKSSGHTAYQIQYSTNSNFTDSKFVTLYNPELVSHMVTKLSTSTQYYVRVRSCKYESKVLYYAVWSAPKIVKTDRRVIVMLDPGHDAKHEGASGITNGVRYKESEYNLKIAMACKEELESYAGVTVLMTRDTGFCASKKSSATDCNEWRVKYAKSKNADYFVAIHLNSGYTYGAEVYYPNQNYRKAIGVKGKALAESIMQEYVELGIRNRGVRYRNSEDNSRYADGSLADYYHVIKSCKKQNIVGIITESCYLNSSSDFKKFLSSDEKLKKLGQAQARGIAQCIGLSAK